LKSRKIIERNEIPTFDNLFPASKIPRDFMAWPYIDNLFDYTKILGKKKIIKIK
jgi:hypothetical protein